MKKSKELRKKSTYYKRKESRVEVITKKNKTKSTTTKKNLNDRNDQNHNTHLMMFVIH